MKTPHKHAELIKAWAEGAEIEQRSKSERLVVFNGNEWEDFDGYWFNDNEVEYRIKSEPKPDRVYYGVFNIEDVISGKRIIDSCFSCMEDAGDDIKLTFDGETGKLKSAEVL